MKTITFQVKGMMCAGCENRVNNAVKAIDGVNSVVANAKEGSVTCEFDDTKTSVENIKETIEIVGYDVIA